MKLIIPSATTLFSLLTMFTGTINANNQVKFTYKENSNQAYTQSYWQVDPCIDINYFSMFASDGYVKTSGSKKTVVKSVSGSATFYTNCKSTGATRTDLSFYSTEPVTGLSFTQLTNVTIATNITAFFSKTQCVIQSYEYPDFEPGNSEETYSYYVCGDEFDSGTQTLTIDTILTLPQPGQPSSDYSSYNKGVTRGPGYISKFESKSRCKTAVATKNIIKFGKKAPFVIPDTEFSTSSEICKAQSGSTERIMFTEI